MKWYLSVKLTENIFVVLDKIMIRNKWWKKTFTGEELRQLIENDNFHDLDLAAPSDNEQITEIKDNEEGTSF